MAEVSGIESKFTADISDLKAKMDIVIGQMTKVKTSTADVAKGFALGTLAIQGIEKGFSMLAGFMVGAIQESINFQQVMSQVKVNVENSGASFAKVGPKIEEYANQMTNLGFKDEDTAQSLSKLLMATGDYDKAIKVNGLAMDLSRSKHIDLSTATQSVMMAMAGNVRMLKQYGISLEAGASGAEILDALQKKVKNSAEAYANTTAGKLEIVNAKWEESKRQIGDAVMPAIGQLMSEVMTAMPTIIAATTAFVQVIVMLVSWINNAINAWSNLSEMITGSSANIDTGLNSQLDRIAMAYNVQQQKLGKAGRITAEGIAGLPIKEQTKLIKEFGKHTAAELAPLKVSIQNITDGFEGIGKAAKDTSSQTKNLADEFKNFVFSMDDAAIKHKETIEKIKSDIVSVTQDYKNSEADAQASREDAIANIVKTSQDKIKILKEQLMQETAMGQSQDEVKIAQTQNELAKEQALLATHASDVKAVQGQLNKDDITKENEKYAKEETKRKEEYDKKLTDLKTQTDKENEAYDKGLAGLADKFKGNWDDIISYIRSSATPQMVAAVKEMMKAVSDVSNTSGLKISVPNLLSVPGKNKHDVGGMITETGLHLLHAGEQVIPRSKVESSPNQNLSINFYGGMTLSKEADENRLVDKIRNVMKNDFELSRHGLY